MYGRINYCDSRSYFCSVALTLVFSKYQAREAGDCFDVVRLREYIEGGERVERVTGGGEFA